jgi:hypothetical protein
MLKNRQSVDDWFTLLWVYSDVNTKWMQTADLAAKSKKIHIITTSVRAKCVSRRQTIVDFQKKSFMKIACSSHNLQIVILVHKPK